MTDRKFMDIADKFIDVANRENQSTNATKLHMAFLSAAARYNAHVVRNILEIDEHEPYVSEMLRSRKKYFANL